MSALHGYTIETCLASYSEAGDTRALMATTRFQTRGEPEAAMVQYEVRSTGQPSVFFDQLSVAITRYAEGE